MFMVRVFDPEGLHTIAFPSQQSAVAWVRETALGIDDDDFGDSWMMSESEAIRLVRRHGMIVGNDEWFGQAILLPYTCEYED